MAPLFFEMGLSKLFLLIGVPFLPLLGERFRVSDPDELVVEDFRIILVAAAEKKKEILIAVNEDEIFNDYLLNLALSRHCCCGRHPKSLGSL